MSLNFTLIFKLEFYFVRSYSGFSAPWGTVSLPLFPCGGWADLLLAYL